ncbi:MAG: serine/threonine-protein kinase [Acidobacteriota bacterium]
MHTDLEREKRIHELLDGALDRPQEARLEFLRREVGDDLELLEEVQDLLGGDTLGDFLEQGVLPGNGMLSSVARLNDELPHRIGPYRVLGLLGEGGMGRVYLAEQSEPVARQVALKVIGSSLAGREMHIRFESERRVLARLAHPNIAQIYEAGVTEEGFPYFAMEYVGGSRITEYCDQERLTVEQRLDLFVAICRGVHHAHQKQIVHRDLKPGNILVAEIDGHAMPKIIDFGIAKTLDASGTDTTTLTGSRIIGTPAYMSPESMTGMEDLDTRTDVYALGVLLYELLTGGRPFDITESNVVQAVQQAGSVTPPRPSTRVDTETDSGLATADARGVGVRQLKRRLRGDLDWILLKAIERDRDLRYESAAALAEDVLRHLRREAVFARLPNVRYQMAIFLRRNWLLVIASALLFASLVAGLAGIYQGLLRAREAEQAARDETAAARQAQVETQEVVDLLIELFQAPDVTSMRNRDVRPVHEITALEVLERGRERLTQEELAEQPLTRARLQSVLGEVYRQLGLYEDADALMSGALELREQHLEKDHPDIGRSHYEVGVMASRRGDTERAEVHLRKAVFNFMVSLDESDPVYPSAFEVLGRVKRQRGEFEEASSLIEKAREIRLRVLGPDHPDHAFSLSNLGNLAFSQGQFEQAETHFRGALKVLRKNLDAEHPRSVMMLANVAAAIASQGRHADALPLAEEALELRTRVLGEDHPDVGDSLNNVGVLSMDLGQYEDAERYHRQALELRRRTLGPEHSRTGWSLHNLAVALDRLGRFAEAEKLHREALALREKSLGRAHPDVGRSAESLGELLWRSGRVAEGEALIRRALGIYEAALPADSDTLIGAREDFAELLREAGREAEAERLFE